jgi:Resolvase, N terminal domain
MQKRAAIYVRVSTDKQTVENQLRQLRQIAERRGWERGQGTMPELAAPRARQRRLGDRALCDFRLRAGHIALACRTAAAFLAIHALIHLLRLR